MVLGTGCRNLTPEVIGSPVFRSAIVAAVEAAPDEPVDPALMYGAERARSQVKAPCSSSLGLCASLVHDLVQQLWGASAQFTGTSIPAWHILGTRSVPPPRNPRERGAPRVRCAFRGRQLLR